VRLQLLDLESVASQNATSACRREDLEDLIAEPAYFKAVFHSLDSVKRLYHAQAELGVANESIARVFPLTH